MTQKPFGSHNGAIDVFFGDDEYKFRLRLDEVFDLQEKCKAGIAHIRRRLTDDLWYAEDVYETIRLGLIGGGMSEGEAYILARKYCGDGNLARWAHLAVVIILAALFGPADDQSKDEPAGKEKTETDGSTPPSSTAPEPSLDLHPMSSDA